MKSLKKRILKALHKGRNILTNAIDHLEKSGHSLNNVSGNLLKLEITLQNDFKMGSTFHKTMVITVRVYGYAAALALITGAMVLFLYVIRLKLRAGRFGSVVFFVALCFVIIVLVVEFWGVGKITTDFAETQKVFNNLVAIVKDAQTKMKEVKIALNEEIRAQDQIIAKIEETETFVEDWMRITETLERSTGQLIDMCEQYITNADENSKLNLILH